MMNGSDTCLGKLALHPFAWASLIEYYDIAVDECTSGSCQEITSLSQFVSYEDECIEIQH